MVLLKESACSVHVTDEYVLVAHESIRVTGAVASRVSARIRLSCTSVLAYARARDTEDVLYVYWEKTVLARMISSYFGIITRVVVDTVYPYIVPEPVDFADLVLCLESASERPDGASNRFRTPVTNQRQESFADVFACLSTLFSRRLTGGRSRSRPQTVQDRPLDAEGLLQRNPQAVRRHPDPAREARGQRRRE